MDTNGCLGNRTSLRHRKGQFISLCAAAFLLFSATGFSTAEDAAIVEANTQFAFDLYRELSPDQPGKNIFFSPFSISTALAMTYTGARGETEAQMARALHFSLPQQQLHPAFSALLDDLKNGKEYQLAVANRLWGQKDYPFLKHFLANIDTLYRGAFEQVDYLHAPEESRRRINLWVEEQTRRKIKELLIKEDITQLTRLVLTNAIYFKGSWSSKFDPQNTTRAPFRLENGETVPAPIMSQTGRFRYFRDNLFEMLEMPYAGDRLSMFILLPQEGVALGKAESMLTADRLESWRSAMEETEVRVFLPKFKTTTRFELNAPLMALGMTDAFDEELADFTGIIEKTEKKDLYISKVVHKAFVDVNEEGTEAAAATAVVMSTKSLRMETIFRADHPFVFCILDKKSGSLLFLGRLMNPR